MPPATSASSAVVVHLLEHAMVPLVAAGLLVDAGRRLRRLHGHGRSLSSRLDQERAFATEHGSVVVAEPGAREPRWVDGGVVVLFPVAMQLTSTRPLWDGT